MSKTGYIYKICCKDSNITEIYIGSTQNIKEGKRSHRACCKNPQDKHYNLYIYQFMRENGGFENWDMIVLKEVINTKKHELRKFEREEFEKLKPKLNSQKPRDISIESCGGIKQYQIENSKQYYQENKTERNKYTQQRYQQKKVEISKWQKCKQNCICGGKYTNSGKSKHLKSEKHLTFLRQENN